MEFNSSGTAAVDNEAGAFSGWQMDWHCMELKPSVAMASTMTRRTQEPCDAAWTPMSSQGWEARLCSPGCCLREWLG